ncbi:MAG: class I SAM-dependent rRNA methyltransferase [Pseudomonadota bacterium]
MITMRKGADRRLRKGFLWVFSNEIAAPPVAELEPGSIHELRDSLGEFLGMAYANPSSLITARILSRRRTDIDESFIRSRIEQALELRGRLYPDRSHYRLVYGEGDLIPGLVVDRYGDYLVVQSNTAGMDRLLDLVTAALTDLLTPLGIYLRNDSGMRSLEGLPQTKTLLSGSVPERVEISTDGVRSFVDIINGQKSGFFLDQEGNRALVRRYTPAGGRVLDLFCYTGAWGIHAAVAGAGEVTGVDSSVSALKLAEENAELNGVADRFLGRKDNVIDFLKKTKEQWDLAVLDPPAFIKGRAHIKEGTKGYIDVNRRTLTKIKHGGILITCSCSHHLSLDAFYEVLGSASLQSGKDLRILEIGSQGPDHPVPLTMPEMRYLKVIVAQVL